MKSCGEIAQEALAAFRDPTIMGSEYLEILRKIAQDNGTTVDEILTCCRDIFDGPDVEIHIYND